MFGLAGFYRSASAFMNLLMGALKIASEYYPGRLHKAFVIDPPSLFAYMWKVTNEKFKIHTFNCTILAPYHVLLTSAS